MKRNISTLLLVAGFAFIASYYYPHLTISPGSVKEYHKKYENDCNKCHTPFGGVADKNCLACHNFFDAQNASENIDSAKSIVSVPIKNLHKVTKETSCYRCHPEHEAIHLSAGSGKFHDKNLIKGGCKNCHLRPDNRLHDNLTSCNSCHNTKDWRDAQYLHKPDQKDCTSCHKKPIDKKHENSGGDCGKCHNTRTWKGAEFRHKENQKDCLSCHKKPENPFHSKYGSDCAKCHNTKNWKQAEFRHEANQKDCLSCHKKPADSFHSLSGSDCGKCHNTKNWKSANFDHSRFFVLSGYHRAKCETCHTGGNYNTYSCYGCHKHNEAKISRKHRGMGIKSIEKCTDCHRSGNEREAWRNMQKLPGIKMDSTTSATGRSQNRSGSQSKGYDERGHENDDDGDHEEHDDENEDEDD